MVCHQFLDIDQDNVIKLLQHEETSVNISNLANTINEAFVSPMSDFLPPPTDFYLLQDTSLSPSFVVSYYMDDATMTEYIPKKHTSNIQEAISGLKL